MANKLAKLGRERSLRTLAQRLFVIDGPDATEKLRHAEAALLRANPDLAKPEGFSSGKRVIVPGDIGLAATDRVEKTGESASGLLDETGVRLDLAGKAFAQRFDAAGRADAAKLEKIADRTFVRNLRKALPETAAILPKTRETLGKRAEEDKDRAERFSKSIAEAQEMLAALRALAERQR
ncbi:hypothetical protein ACXYMO_03940 [Arenibacterium sp. CAU 1754]